MCKELVINLKHCSESKRGYFNFCILASWDFYQKCIYRLSIHTYTHVFDVYMHCNGDNFIEIQLWYTLSRYSKKYIFKFVYLYIYFYFLSANSGFCALDVAVKCHKY